MLTKAWDTTADCTVALLLHYIFDLGGYSARELVEHWLRHYPASWVRLAAIEALYQGRYKAISVEQILGVWQRRGQVLPHFNCEFERLVCGNIQPRLSRQPPLTANSYHLISKPAARLNNGNVNKGNLDNSDRRFAMTKTDADTVESTSVQVINITAKSVPATKQMNAAPTQSKHRQISNHHNHKSKACNLLPALSSSANQQPIRQFNPQTTKSSEFYTKLKAISQHN
ncbi:MAG TPA: hypothetical protein DEV81_09680 [Cyanobacteria bacterium UBA11049]|nr:hypothetical protein [Cyanobacteria bacterium UBA11049]